MENIHQNKSWYSINSIEAKKGKSTDIFIYDEIGVHGITAKSFLQDLKDLGGKDITLHINSTGGDVFEGQAIYTSLKNYTGKVTAKIEGLAASMATVIALAADTIEMTSNSLFMIHSPMSNVFGNKSQMRKQINALEKVEATMLKVYSKRTGLDEDKISYMLDSETWLSADEAKEMGFIDSISGKVEIVAKYDITGFENKTAEEILTTFGNEPIKTEKEMDESTMKNWFAEIKNLIIGKAEAQQEQVQTEAKEEQPQVNVSELEAKINALTEERDSLSQKLSAEKEKANESKEDFKTQFETMTHRISKLEATPSVTLAENEPKVSTEKSVQKDEWGDFAKSILK
jgi:ATP-dependent Clp endopeptidase proteolytic subunit ClpP